jgi:hypothetical protein
LTKRDRDEVTLAERWNGRRWSIERTPNPAGAKASELEAVSCAPATTCTAVGHSDNLALVERYSS